MEIHQLRYFVAVAEAGGFSQAAERCSVSQPSLSQQIKKLERDLGLELFDRVPRGAVLTEAGHAFLPRARSILAEVRLARSAVQQDLEDGSGPLAVGAIPTMAPFLLPPTLERFRDEFPRCELTVREDLTERLLDAVAGHELDCAVMSTPVEHPRLTVEVLGWERLLLATAPGHPLPDPARLTVEQLHDQPTIVVHEMHCLGRQIEGFCSQRGWRRRIVCRSSQLATVQRLVGLGLGVSLLPEMAARAEGPEGADTSGGLRYLPLRHDKAAPRREIAVVRHVDRTPSRLARRFVEILRRDLERGRYRLGPPPASESP